MLQFLLAFLLSIGPLIFYFSLAIFSRRFLFDDEQNEGKAGGAEQAKTRQSNRQLCTSPGCVRCNKNKQVIGTAIGRFVSAGYGRQGANGRIKQALEAAQSENTAIFLHLETVTERPIWRGEELPREFNERLELLEQNHQMLVEECEKALQFGYLWRRNEEAQNGSSWFTYSLINQGAWQDQQCRECPRLTSLLHQLDSGQLLTDCLFGNVFISMLPANSAIAEHRGLTNARLRVHFALEVPTERADKCFMLKFHWTAGTATVIDDSFPHSVSSMGCAQDRIVLVLDFWNPDIDDKEREALRHVFPAIYS